MSEWKVADPEAQRLLDYADQMYYVCAPEHGGKETMDSLKDALMAAWDFILYELEYKNV